MARRQAKRRKQTRRNKMTLPVVQLRRVMTPILALLVILATYEASIRLLDSEIQSIEVSGPFQRVTALQIEEAVSDELDAGFLGADLLRIQDRVRALPWIDQARVARRWPNRISISVSEQVPAAIWGTSGLLNVRGELFVTDARHVPAELPRLSGPDDRSGDVARRYLDVRDRLIPIGLDVRSVAVDGRGAWRMTLTNGVEIRFGRRDVNKRTDLFVDIVADVITGRANDIEYVDMRYSNGFTIGWVGGKRTPIAEPESMDEKLLAARDAG